ncbi:MAG: hypothetical protein RML72_08820 [Bacteroidia bacterium]|nr:hypothetical protein [Bacteroidia bacterium]MDW8158957.1 hypothetical protein [Bacteroidia bacterium]
MFLLTDIIYGAISTSDQYQHAALCGGVTCHLLLFFHVSSLEAAVF